MATLRKIADGHVTQVYGSTTGRLLGLVCKNAVGNWVASDYWGNKLTELRPTIHGDKTFDYFSARKHAVRALELRFNEVE